MERRVISDRMVKAVSALQFIQSVKGDIDKGEGELGSRNHSRAKEIAARMEADMRALLVELSL